MNIFICLFVIIDHHTSTDLPPPIAAKPAKKKCTQPNRVICTFIDIAIGHPLCYPPPPIPPKPPKKKGVV